MLRVASLSATALPIHAPAAIMLAVSEAAVQQGGKAMVLYGRGHHLPMPGIEAHRINSPLGVSTHAALSRLFDREGLLSKRAASIAATHLHRFRPDVVHLHIIHGHYIHYPHLLDELHRLGAPVVITLHDLWWLTGRCCFPGGCQAWKDNCSACPDKGNYPPTLLSMGRIGAGLRRLALDKIDNVTFVAPSEWAMEQFKQSKLNRFPCVRIANGVDRIIFHPASEADTMEGLNILAIANRWEPRKHLEQIAALASQLRPDEHLTIVGPTDGLIDTSLHNITLIPHITDRTELADLYRQATVTVSASTEETFGMTIAESLACGTPVVVDSRCATAELVKDPSCGQAIDTSDPVKFLTAIRDVASQKDAPSLNEEYEAAHMAARYLQLFSDITR